MVAGDLNSSTGLLALLHLDTGHPKWHIPEQAQTKTELSIVFKWKEVRVDHGHALKGLECSLLWASVHKVERRVF